MGQIITTSQFYLYGKKHFTQTGYLKHIASYREPVQSRADIGIGQEGADGQSLAGQTILITGANSGIGQQIATYCAAKAAQKVIMVCRNGTKAEAAKQEIVAATNYPVHQVQVVVCDLGELSQIKSAVANDITDATIDCIVCNAGVLLHEENTSSEGWEQTFASHLLGGTYHLCQLLRSRLKQAAAAKQNHDPRIIIVSSGGMYNTKLPDWNVMTSYSQNKDERAKASSFKYDGTMAYAYAKRGQVLLAECWAKEFPEITTVTAHPGWTHTPAVDEAYGDSKKYLEPMRSPWQGAEGICWLIASKPTDPKTKLESGALYLDRTVQRKHLAGPFFGEGSFTKNTDAEVQTFLDHLKKATID